MKAALTVLLAVAVALAGLAVPGRAQAATSVTTAIGSQDGSTASVTGYVVGQPVGSDQVLTTGFPNDYALALADSAGATDPAAMLYVQLSSAFRADWGLSSNAGLLGDRITVTGTLTPYFSPHAGLKNPTAITAAGAGEPDPDPGDPGDPDPGAGDDYYQPALGKTGPELRAALHDIIDGHTQLSYDQVWDALKRTDEDPDNSSNVIELYSRRSVPKSSNGGDPDDWNREHTWAKSHGDFGTSAGPGTDIHHLRPADVSVNADRGNLDFDLGGSAVDECSGCLRDGDSFEPPDEVKGDVARMLFYMAIRYEGDDGKPDLELNDKVANGSAPLHGKLSVLLAWHAADPVSASEQRRNEIIYTDYQHNRNPFIDHPEWAESLW